MSLKTLLRTILNHARVRMVHKRRPAWIINKTSALYVRLNTKDDMGGNQT